MRLNTTKFVLVALSTLALFAFATPAKTAPPVEIRFCPVAGVWTYPLESRRELQSLLLQNVAVVNHGKTAFDVKAIELELLQAGQILDTRGVSYVGWGASFHTGHRWAIPEEFALDIAKLGGDGLSHKGDGTRFEDYYAYGAEILAAADGRVIAMANNELEDPAAMQRPDESQQAYFERLQKDQATRVGKGTSGLAGNYVMIDHGKNEYSFYAHMQPGSVRIRVGDQVKAGDVIGKLGSSGNSTEPHLHFHVCNSDDPLMSAGIPVNFSNVTIQWADLPSPSRVGTS